MSRLPDLARDSLLYTEARGQVTTHFFPEVDEAGRRSYRTEQWKYERALGTRGRVRLERCISSGQRQSNLRAVKRIDKESRPQRDISRGLEAIAKFSNDRVSSLKDS